MKLKNSAPVARLLAWVTAAAAARSALAAEPLIDRVPADAIAYVGWHGVADPAPGYARSHLQNIVDHSNVRQAFASLMQQAIDRAAAKQPDQTKQTALARQIATAAWTHPTAIYAEHLRLDAHGGPQLNVTAICRTGAADAASLQSAIEAVGADPMVHVSVDGDDLVVTISTDPPVALTGGLAGVPAYADAIKQVAGANDPVMAVFVDTQAIVSQVSDLIAKGDDADAKQRWPAVRDALGLAGIHRFAYTAGFDGQDWATRTFIDAPAPRKGLVGLIDGGPIDTTLLKRIPATAGYAAIVPFDFKKIFALVHDVAKAAAPDHGEENVQRGLGLAKLFVGADVEKDVFSQLGSQWAVYTDAGFGGDTPMAIAVANKLADPAAATAGITKLAYAISNLAAAQTRQTLNLKGTAQTVSGTKVYSMPILAFAPSFAIKDGYLYLGIDPTPATEAANYATGLIGASFSSTPALSGLHNRLAKDAKEVQSFDFADLPKTAPATYVQLQSLISMAQTFVSQQGITVPPDLLPPLSIIRPELSTAGSIGWADDAGLYNRSVSPFPGAALLGPQAVSSTGVGGGALAVSVMLPALNRARETANK